MTNKKVIERLSPQTPEQNHWIQIMLAKLQGKKLLVKLGNDWVDDELVCVCGKDTIWLNHEYRISDVKSET